MAVATKTLTPTNQVVNLPDMTEPPDNSVNVDNAGKLADAVNALDRKIPNTLPIKLGSNESYDFNAFEDNVITSLSTYQKLAQNAPINSQTVWFCLTMSDGTYKSQIALNWGGSHLYIRAYSGSWSNWVTL